MMENREDSAETTSASVEESTRLAISIEHFSAFYGDFQALHDINLEAPAERVTALIGPSGCGKSTLLRWINRMNDLVVGARAEGRLQLGDFDILQPGVDVVEPDLDDSERNGFAAIRGRMINPPFNFGSGGIELLAKEMTADLQALRARALASPGERIDLVSKGIAFGWIRYALQGR